MTAPTDAPQTEATEAAAAAETTAPRARDWVAMLAPVVAGLIAVPGSVSALEAFLEGRSLLFFWGQLAALGLLAVMIIATVVLFGRILRHRGVFVTSILLGMLVMVGLAVSLHTVAFRVPPAVGGGIDLILLIWSVIGMRRLRGAGQPTVVETDAAENDDEPAASDVAAGDAADTAEDGRTPSDPGSGTGTDAEDPADGDPADGLPASYPPPTPAEADAPEPVLRRAERHARWAVWRLRLLDWVFVILAALGCLLTLLGY